MIRIEGLTKDFPDRDGSVLRELRLEVAEGELVALVGRSGSGKTTLLNIIGGLDRRWSGSVRVADLELGRLADRKLADFRRRTVGFVFQDYHLLDHLSCAANVSLASRFGGRSGPSPAAAKQRAREVLSLVGLAELADSRPRRLSGGERQRVAIARALFNRPRILLLDEPTGNLDQATGRDILELLSKLHRAEGLTILAATHDAAIATAGRRRLRLADGVVTETPEDLR